MVRYFGMLYKKLKVKKNVIEYNAGNRIAMIFLENDMDILNDM